MRPSTVTIFVFSLIAFTPLRSWSDVGGSLEDGFDDPVLLYNVDSRDDLKPSRAAWAEQAQRLLQLHLDAIERLFGKPTSREAHRFVLPVAQLHFYSDGGLRYPDDRMNHDHNEFYAIGDFAGVEVHYEIDGSTPETIVFFCRVNPSCPKLSSKTNFQERDQWDHKCLDQVVKFLDQHNSTTQPSTRPAA